jgi:hypothetical protein
VAIPDSAGRKLFFMTEELRHLLQMKRTSKFILLLVGFVVASVILQLAIVVGSFNPDEVQQYMNRKVQHVSHDTVWSVLKPSVTPTPHDSHVNNTKDFPILGNP